MIKAIFFDIDGTLLNSNGRVSKSTKQAIKSAQEKGVLCGISTGRGPSSVEAIVRKLDLDMFVTYNGQLVYTTEKTIYARPFEHDVLQTVVTYANEHSRQLMFGSRFKMDGSLTMKMSQSSFVRQMARFIPSWFPIRWMKRLLQKFSPNRRVGRYSNLAILQEPIYQCVMLSAEYETETLKAVMPSCEFQRSNPYTLDILPKGASKLQGIRFFLADQGILLTETMAFGDHFNDIEMIQGVGIGVSMGNGTPKTQAVADYVTATNNLNGIEKALVHFKVIEER